MDERLRESLSAMLDDQADELTVRRVLAQGDSDEVQGQWQRWHRLRDELRSPGQPWNSIDIRSDLWQELEAGTGTESRPAPAVAQASSIRSRWTPGAPAVAAMFLVALMAGFGAGQQWSGEPAPGIVQADANGNPGQTTEPVPQVALGQLEPDQRQQLSSYLLHHARHNSAVAGNGAVGFARVASVSGNGAGQ